MFLNQLKQREKELFVDLCIHAANANGIFAEEEKVMLQAYASEMGMPVVTNIADKTLDEVLSELQDKSSMKSKKIITFEIFGLILSDHIYDEDEKKFMNKLSEKLDISDECLETMYKQLMSYEQLCKEIYANMVQ